MKFHPPKPDFTEIIRAYAGRWQEKLSGQKLGGEVVLIPGQKNTIRTEAQARPTGTGVGVVTPPAA
jgi:hypothetical protein